MHKLLMKLIRITLILSFIFVQLSWAEDKRIEDAAELSFVQTGGNTDVMTLSGKNNLKYRFNEEWIGQWDIGVLYGKTDGVEVAERYYTDLRLDYKFTKKLYFYGLGGWLKDKFAGIDQRYYLGPGVGYQFMDGERHFLSAEMGLSYAKEDYTDDTEDDFLEGRAFGKYEFVFNPKTKFSQTAEYLQNFDDSDKFRVNSETAVTTTLTDIISLKVSYLIIYNNRPIPEYLNETDTIFSIALVANF